MNIRRCASGKTDEVISLVEKYVGKEVELADNHYSRVDDIREQGWYINVEGKGLVRRTLYVEDVRDEIVQYARNEIKDPKQILALVILMCGYWKESIEPSSPTFIHAKPLVELLENMKSPYYRGALLIYQAALYEGQTKELWALTYLRDLPIVSMDKSDEYHAMSVWLKGCAYESMKKYIQASEVLSEIGPNDPLSYQLSARTAIAAMKPLAQKQAEDEACVMF